MRIREWHQCRYCPALFISTNRNADVCPVCKGRLYRRARARRIGIRQKAYSKPPYDMATR